MQPTEMNQTVMTWKPALIRLTSIPHPDIAGGVAQPQYLDPSAINMIERVVTKNGKVGANPPEYYDELIQCTRVHCCHFTLNVQEAPEEVARLRDAAFGYEAAGSTPLRSA